MKICRPFLAALALTAFIPIDATPATAQNASCPSLVRDLRAQRRFELRVRLIRAMQDDGGGEHRHLHAQRLLPATKRFATAIERSSEICART